MENCNSTEKWLDEDPDIKYACENVAFGALSEFHAESNKCELPFKNVFCALCNLEVVENISIYECSVGRNVSFYSELDEIGCHFPPKLTFIRLIRIYFVNIVIIKEDFCARISFCFYQNSFCLNTSTGFQSTGIYLYILEAKMSFSRTNHLVNVILQKNIS